MLDRSKFSEVCNQRNIMEGYCPRSEGLSDVYSRNHPPETDKFDKKVRREIANSNERRRMQSINAGFHSLKALIPHHDGEKLSKAAILQQTGEHIQSLEEEKTKLLAQNAHLRVLLERVTEREREKEPLFTDSPPPKRKKRDTESSDEGISMGSSLDSNEDRIEELQLALLEMKSQLDRERWLRTVLEERTRTMESQVFTDKLCDVSNAYVQTDLNKLTNELVEVKTSDDLTKDTYSSYSTSMSRKNLQTIVEAIQHLEGDRLAFEDRKYDERVPSTNLHEMRNLSHAGHSEESEKNSSDQENNSENFDQEVPITYTHRIHRHRLQKQFNEGEETFSPRNEYPIATTILQSFPTQFYSTGMMVHNSS